jgi:hypothetical protein
MYVARARAHYRYALPEELDKNIIALKIIFLFTEIMYYVLL